MGNLIEEAKSGRASCRTCKKAIAKGELRFGEEAANAFGDTPSMRWHHMTCAAEKLPAELKAAMDAHGEAIPNRADLDKIMGDALKGGRGKPGGFPYMDKAPSGRAKCMQCEETIAKDTVRVAVEREFEVNGNPQRGAGYLHPKCVAENLENTGGDLDEMIEGLKANSRLQQSDIDGALAEISA
jgi:poly [ADP-ribose] polymerase